MVNFSKQTIKIIAIIAPVEFAKTSKKSAFLVFVKIPCANSIEIPKEKEAKTIKVFKFGFCDFSFVEKYKYHRKTKTKWKAKCTNLSKSAIRTCGISENVQKHKPTIKKVQKRAAQK